MKAIDRIADQDHRERRTMSAVKAAGQKKLLANELKWGSALVEAGWTMVPSTILERQQALGLDPLDLNILLQLAKHWWKPGNPPRPSIKSIAQCVGKSVSTVQRRLTKMRNDGLIDIEHRHNQHGGQTTSNYHFRGLIEAATKYAEEALEEREAKAKAEEERRLRKGLKRSTANLKIAEE